MKTTLTILLSLTLGGAAHAAPLLTLNPSVGPAYAQPGDTTGWGFTLTADPLEWTTIIGTVVLNQTLPTLGQFTDFISGQGGPLGGVLGPGAPDWVQYFDPFSGTGFGSYRIDPSALPGDVDTGTFLVLYETFSDNPNTCGSCFTGSGALTVDYAVVATPEPSTWVLGLLGVAGVAAARLRMRYTPQDGRTALSQVPRR